MKFVLKVKTKGITRSHVIEARSEDHAKQKIASMYLKSEILAIHPEDKPAKANTQAIHPEDKPPKPNTQAIPNFLLKK